VQRILVAYATKAGATQGVSELIGRELGAGGASVEVLPAADVQDVAGYEAVVVGSGIRMGQWYSEALDLVSAHAAALSTKPVAYFVVCGTMRECTGENRETVLGYFDQVQKRAPEVDPVDVGLFAGAIDPSKLGFAARLILKATKAELGDWRDWDAIQAWAAELLHKLA